MLRRFALASAAWGPKTGGLSAAIRGKSAYIPGRGGAAAYLVR